MKVEASNPRRSITLELDADEAARLALAIQTIPHAVRQDEGSVLRPLHAALCAVRDNRPYEDN